MTNKIDKLVIELGNYCRLHRITIVTAESCTGGVAYALSKGKVSSSILERGYVSYSNQSKSSLLSVKLETLQLHGAVSKNVAIEMAEGGLKNSLAQVSLAITGLAGEDTDAENTWGKAWVSVCRIDQKPVSKELTFKGSRLEFINYTIESSIRYLSKILHKQD